MEQDLPERGLHLEAYRLLVSMLQHDDNLFWRRNEFLLTINGGLLTILGILKSNQPASPAFSLKAVYISIPIFGLIVCFLWLLIARRGEAFYNHWYEQLKFIEGQYLSPIRIFLNADDYFAKGHVKLGQKEFRLDNLTQRIRMTSAMKVMPFVFAVVWIVLGLILFFG